MPPPSSTRLVLVTQEFYPFRGGIAVYAAEMALAATKQGFAVEVWAPALPEGTAEASWPFKVRRLPFGNTHSWLNQWKLIRAFQRLQDTIKDAILYIPEPGPLKALALLQLVSPLPHCRLCITLHGSEILSFARWPLLSLRIHQLFARAERIGVVSRYAQNLLSRHFPPAGSKALITSGALRNNFLPAAQAGENPGNPIIILTVARLHPRKGQLRVIEALAALPTAQKSNLEYWLAGTHARTAYEKALHQAAARAGFPVKFLGDVPDEKLGALFVQADIFAMTSMTHGLSVEGFGLVYLEAGAHGLPIVAHAIGGVPEAVVSDETGLLVPPEDPAALTAAFARLINDPVLRRRLGEAGRHRALARTWRDNVLTLFGQPGTDPTP
jgi:phosphatidyl-myo-inositol dimannoside synthase